MTLQSRKFAADELAAVANVQLQFWQGQLVECALQRAAEFSGVECLTAGIEFLNQRPLQIGAQGTHTDDVIECALQIRSAFVGVIDQSLDRICRGDVLVAYVSGLLNGLRVAPGPRLPPR